MSNFFTSLVDTGYSSVDQFNRINEPKIPCFFNIEDKPVVWTWIFTCEIEQSSVRYWFNLNFLKIIIFSFGAVALLIISCFNQKINPMIINNRCPNLPLEYLSQWNEQLEPHPKYGYINVGYIPTKGIHHCFIWLWMKFSRSQGVKWALINAC